MKEPLISVLVPVYNIERYIGQCIESIILQTYKNLEIILVDDGSTDRSGEICDLYARKDPRIKVIHKENGGLVSARKAGMKISTGEYIGYVDGDDWIGPGFYSALISSAIYTESDIVIAGFSRDLFNKTTWMLNAIPSGVYENEKLKDLFSSMISYGTFFRHGITTYVWNKLFKRDCVYENQMHVDERITIGEDGAVTYPAMLNAKKVCITDNCAYHYRQREDSMLKKNGNFFEESKKLFVLYSYLNNALLDYDKQFNLKNQITEYILSTYIIRSGGILFSSSTTVYQPFVKEFIGKKVIICGAGTFGQQLYSRIKELNYCTIVNWLDDDYWEYRRCCLDVNPLSLISKLEFDYVIIGMVDSFSSECMKKKLLDFGVEEKKILIVNSDRSKIQKNINYFLEYNN